MAKIRALALIIAAVLMMSLAACSGGAINAVKNTAVKYAFEDTGKTYGEILDSYCSNVKWRTFTGNSAVPVIEFAGTAPNGQKVVIQWVQGATYDIAYAWTLDGVEQDLIKDFKAWIMLAAEGSRESVSETPQTVVSTPEQSVPTERAGLDTDVTPFSIREGYSADAASIPAIITEKEVVSVETGSDADFGNYVKLTFDESGKAAFAEATKRLAGSGTMSVWIGETVMMNPSVGGQIVNGEVLLMCDTKEQADYLAKQIRHAAGLQ